MSFDSESNSFDDSSGEEFEELLNEKQQQSNTVQAGSFKCLSPIQFSQEQPKICPNLVCKKCDVKVSILGGYSFLASADYLFFRTHFANEKKIKSKAEPS